jgi:uncharacterized coiled-coil protein SlyX
MNDPKCIDELERRFDTFEDETNHNLTMLLGQAWKQGEQLRGLKNLMVERFERLDHRVTEAHKELSEQNQHLARIEIAMATKEDVLALKTTQTEHSQCLGSLSKDVSDLKTTMTEQGQKLDWILALLQQRSNER